MELEGHDEPAAVPQTSLGRWWERHPRHTRFVALVALAWTTAYLGYRFALTGRRVNLVGFGFLGLIEVYNFVSLGFLTFFGWGKAPTVHPEPKPGHEVDVYVATYDEPIEVVEATLVGCKVLAYPHRTYLLDDGRRPGMAELARRLDAPWITRPDNSHAKAGNINHALGMTTGELVFFLDADHVPLPDALDALVGYFEDPSIALVQSPHDFYNQDSVQHYELGRHEQSLFFRVISVGKDRCNSAFWCGSAALVRKSALEEIGGVATETIAEDFHTTMKLHALGWRTRYHDEVLVQGMAPVDLCGYLLQRDRWARGNLAVLRLPESPLRRKAGLSALQRVSYLASLFAYSAGAIRLLSIGLLATILYTGMLPARLTLVTLGVLWVPATLLSMVATSALSLGHLRLRESTHHVLVTSEIFTRALRSALWPARTRFKVTPKHGVDTGGWRALRHLRVVLALSAALAGAVAWRAAVASGAVHARALPGWATGLALGLGCWELGRIARSIYVISRRRQRRDHFRFPCATTASTTSNAGTTSVLDGARVVDVSTAGLGLVTDHRLDPDIELAVRFHLPAGAEGDLPVHARVVTRSAEQKGDGSWRIGTEIVQLDDDSRENVVRYCHVVLPYLRLRGALHETYAKATSETSAA